MTDGGTLTFNSRIRIQELKQSRDEGELMPKKKAFLTPFDKSVTDRADLIGTIIP